MLLVRHLKNNHVSSDTVMDFEEELLKYPGWEQRTSLFPFLGKLSAKVKPFRSMIGLYNSSRRYFSVLIDISFLKEGTFPYFYFHSDLKAIYLFDLWEPLILSAAETIKDFHIDYIFVSASQSAVLLKKKMPDKNIFWIPEGINISKCKPERYDRRDIDVIQFGRRYEEYHEKIYPYCTEKKISYLFEKEKGKLVFSDMNDFYSNLGKCKISICVPSSVTSPERSGSISTMTQRYLQSMGSKCLVLGIAPAELIEVYGYNPVIEIDMKNPCNQLEDILNNYNEYIPLIEKNYQVTLQQGWDKRAESIINLMGRR